MLKHLPAPSQGINLSSAYLLRDLADALSIINKYGNDELKSAKRDLIEYSFRFRTSDIKFQNQLFELLSFGAQDEILQVLLNHEPFMIIMTDKNLDLLYQYVKYRENENTLSKPVASDMLNNIKAEIELRSPKPMLYTS